MLRKLYLKYLKADQSMSSAEERNKILITTILSLVTVAFLLIFGVENLVNENLLLASILLSAGLVIFLNYLYLRLTGQHYQTAVFIIILTSILFIYLLITGGSAQSGHLWFFILPSLIYLVLGLRTGTIFVAVLLVIIAYVLFFSGNLFTTGYESAFARRYFAAFVCVTLAALCHEYTREDRRQELLALSNKLSFLSQTDDLTGLANRRAITSLIQHEIVRFERMKRPFCLLIADIDHFKNINDLHGHECGDQVLIGLAETLDKNTKKQDIVSRWGGEEFIILLPETTADQGKISGERLRRAVEEMEVVYGGETIRITISIGLAEYVKGQSFNQIVRSADDRLYQAKRTGRNRVC